MRYDDYVDFVDVRQILKELYIEYTNAKDLIDEFVYELYGGKISPLWFFRVESEGVLWELLELLADGDFDKIIQEMLDSGD